MIYGKLHDVEAMDLRSLGLTFLLLRRATAEAQNGRFDRDHQHVDRQYTEADYEIMIGLPRICLDLVDTGIRARTQVVGSLPRKAVPEAQSSSPTAPRPTIQDSGPLRVFLMAAIIGLFTSPLDSAVPERPPIEVQAPVVLYDGKTVRDLSRFYTWLGVKAYEDPNRVFTVVDLIDSAPAIRLSGEDWGGIVTRESYSRYRLVAEFRWGSVTWRPRLNLARKSGILLHCQGADGNFKPTFDSPWITSIEFEIFDGRTGDAVLVPGYRSRGDTERILPRATMRALPGDNHWNPNGTPREFVSGQSRLHWFGKDPDWKDVLGFRGRRDIEKPSGEWNRLEAIVDGGNMAFLVNGVRVMELTNCSVTHGRILFQSESAEIFFRRIELHPLDDHVNRPVPRSIDPKTVSE